MARRLLIVFATTMAFAAGCGGGSGSGNGEEDKTASRILADARSAATGAGSVHVTGTILDSGPADGPARGRSRTEARRSGRPDREDALHEGAQELLRGNRGGQRDRDPSRRE